MGFKDVVSGVAWMWAGFVLLWPRGVLWRVCVLGQHMVCAACVWLKESSEGSIMGGVLVLCFGLCWVVRWVVDVWGGAATRGAGVWVFLVAVFQSATFV